MEVIEGLDFVYDRTKDDIEKRTQKAFINASDLNRIEKNTEVIGQRISAPVSVRADWEIGGLPRHSDYQRIKENTRMIRAGYLVHDDTPAVPERPYNTFQKWNDIEKILYDVFSIYVKNFGNVIYCGDGFSCGDEIGVI